MKGRKSHKRATGGHKREGVVQEAAVEIETVDEPTQNLKDLYDVFKNSYKLLQRARYEVFLQAKEHFIQKEYNVAHDLFKELLENLHKESQEGHSPSKAVKVCEEIVDHTHHDLLGRMKYEKRKQHVRFTLNEVGRLDELLYLP